MMERNFTISAY